MQIRGLILTAIFCLFSIQISCEMRGGIIYFGAPDIRQIRRAVELAAEEVNADGGVLGKKVEVVFFSPDEASGNSREDASEIALKIVADTRIDFVFGHVDSTASLAASHIYNRAGIINFVPTGSSPLLNQIGKHVFCMSLNNNHQGRVLAEFLKESLGQKRAIVLYENNEYGKTLCRAFLEGSERLGIEIIDISWVFASDQKSNLDVIRFSIETAIQNECENLVVLSDNVVMSHVLEAIDEKGKRFNIFSGDSIQVVNLAEEDTLKYDGVNNFVTFNYNPFSKEEIAVNFKKLFRAKYNNDVPGSISHLSYDALHFLVEVMKKTGFDKEAILGEIPKIDYHGASGWFRFLSNGESRRELYIFEGVNTENITIFDYFKRNSNY